ncbi:glutamate receptor ionotropic, kainate glr-3 [Ischnura elegans]|uniref:glutamate receptor ionotropic, kainate glr-3 n=1 Tax=Ischnura elegans TaxID=197161 RepID=UPI001ED8B05A|nr:glutamate receptor ionotropic, kainate glr-3 [Ischnura elegans]
MTTATTPIAASTAATNITFVEGGSVTVNSSEVQRNATVRRHLLWLMRDLVSRWMGEELGPLRHQLRCAAIVCDAMHVGLVSADSVWDGLPTYEYRVDGAGEEGDDPGLWSVLRAAQGDGCRLAILLLGDGSRAAGILRRGERERRLNTRVDFVLMYDQELFSPQNLHLWRKMVNVLFVKTHRGGGGEDAVPWFEVRTVRFPAESGAGPTYLVEVWSDGAWLLRPSQPGRRLFPDKTLALRGAPLLVSTFDHVPSAVRPSDNASSFSGVEVQILSALAASMGFEARLSEVEGRWGGAANGTGLVGAVARGEADIALGNLVYVPPFLDQFDLSVAYTVQCHTFLTPESRLDNAWLTLVLPFDAVMWLALGAALFATALTHWALAHSLGRPSALVHAILDSWAVLLQVPPPLHGRRWPLRLLRSSYWLFCLLAASAYRSALTATLSSPPPTLNFDTLDDLASARGLVLGALGDHVRHLFTTALDEPSRRLGARFEADTVPEDAVDLAVAARVARGRYAFYENKYWLRAARASYQLSSSSGDAGGYGLHVMRDCALSLPVALGLAPGSPLKGRVDRLLRRMAEAGLVARWTALAMRSTACAERRSMLASTSNQGALVDLKRLFGAVVALASGLALAAVALAAERAWEAKERRATRPRGLKRLK